MHFHAHMVKVEAEKGMKELKAEVNLIAVMCAQHTHDYNEQVVTRAVDLGHWGKVGKRSLSLSPNTHGQPDLSKVAHQVSPYLNWLGNEMHKE